MKNKKIDIGDAEHPLRQIAILLIEDVFEPWFDKNRGDENGIDGEEYYELEDQIVDLLSKNQKIT